MGNSLRDIVFLVLRAGWRRRFLIIVPILLLPPIGFAIGLHAAKTYEAHMTMLIQEPAKDSPYLDDLAVSTRLQERMPVLKSLVRNTQFIEAVATDVGLITEATPNAIRRKITDQIATGLTIELIGTDLVELLGTGLAVLAELGDTSVRYCSDVERTTGLRALARFPGVLEEGETGLSALPKRPAVLAIERSDAAKDTVVRSIKSYGV
jgi:capsular polysaccharide biosynthesis protein